MSNFIGHALSAVLSGMRSVHRFSLVRVRCGYRDYPIAAATVLPRRCARFRLTALICTSVCTRSPLASSSTTSPSFSSRRTAPLLKFPASAPLTSTSVRGGGHPVQLQFHPARFEQKCFISKRYTVQGPDKQISSRHW